MTEGEIHPENKARAADKTSPLPLRVLLPRALAAMVIGGVSFHLLARFWCLILGNMLFPSVFPNGRGLMSANMSVGLTMFGGALFGLVFVCARGNK